MDVFNKWHVAFHGTRVDSVNAILECGDLLIPGIFFLFFAQEKVFRVIFVHNLVANLYYPISDSDIVYRPGIILNSKEPTHLLTGGVGGGRGFIKSNSLFKEITSLAYSAIFFPWIIYEGSIERRSC